MKARTWLSAAGLAAVAIVAALVGAARAQTPQTEPDFPRGRISGLVYADYYYNATGDPVHRYNATGADDRFRITSWTASPIDGWPLT